MMILKIIHMVLCVFAIGFSLWTLHEIEKDNMRREHERRFGIYPACDHLNNAIRLLLNGGKREDAIKQIERAIYDVGGYFHEDVMIELSDMEERDEKV